MIDSERTCPTCGIIFLAKGRTELCRPCHKKHRAARQSERRAQLKITNPEKFAAAAKKKSIKAKESYANPINRAKIIKYAKEYYNRINNRIPQQRVCGICGIELSNSNARFCKGCRLARRRQLYAELKVQNPEKYQALVKKKAEEVKRSLRDPIKYQQKINREKIYYRENIEEKKKYRQEYHIKNRNLRNQRTKEWRQHNPHKTATYDANKRSRDPLDSELVKAVYAYYYYTCVYCGHYGSELSLEHILPIARDGTNEFDNLAIACKSCNCSKGDKTLLEYLIYRQKLISAGCKP